jgi:hypothetical protein
MKKNKFKRPKKHNLFDRKKEDNQKNIIKLKVIPEPQPYSRSVLIMDGTETLFFKGYTSNLKFICGNCGAVLMEGIEKNQVKNIVLKCNNCNSFNET